MLERITGPFHGYHIAAYACPMGDLGAQYLGHYRICEQRPKSFCDADCLDHGCCDDLSPTSEMALSAAELQAMRQVAKMPTVPGRRDGLGPPGGSASYKPY